MSIVSLAACRLPLAACRLPLAACRLPLASALLATLYAAPALAAHVDLVSAINVPASTTLTPYQVRVTYTNTQAAATAPATNAKVTITLPPNLYDVRVAAVEKPAGASAQLQCPAPGDFQNVPTGLTAASTAIAVTIPRLPALATDACTVVLEVKSLQQGSYNFASEITAGAGDTETNAATNATHAPADVGALANLKLSYTKTIVSGATLTSPRAWQGAYGTPVVYKLTYKNDSDVDLPLGLMTAPSAWTDAERAEMAGANNTYPEGATTQLGGGGQPACMASGGSVCPAVTVASTPEAFPSARQPITIQYSPGALLKAHSQIDIYYTRTYQPRTCGTQATVLNRNFWNIDSQIVSTPAAPDPAGSNHTYLRLDSPGNPACTGTSIRPVITKTLDKVVKKDGAPRPPQGSLYSIREDGDTAHFTVVIQGDANHDLEFDYGDTFRNISAGGNYTTFFSDANPASPADDLLQYTFKYEGCTPSGAGSQCPTVAPNARTVSASTGVSLPYPAAKLKVGKGETLTLKYTAAFHFRNGGPRCVARRGDMANYVSLKLHNAPAYTLAPGSRLEHDTAATPLALLDNWPRCVAFQANKSITPAQVKPGEEFSFNLAYSNTTSSETHNTLNPPTDVEGVDVTDELGDHFTPTAVVCQRYPDGLGNPATAQLLPGITMANIDTANKNTFKARLPALSDKQGVLCQIKGTIKQPGSYNNTTSIRLVDNTDRWLEVQSMVEANNSSTINYGILLPQSGGGSGGVTPVPVNAPWMLVSLGALLAGGAGLASRRRQRARQR